MSSLALSGVRILWMIGAVVALTVTGTEHTR